CQNIPDDDGRLPTNEIGCQPRQPIRLIVAPAIVDDNVLARDKSGVLQTLLERGRKMFRTCSRCAAEKSNHWHRRLLCTRHERPRSCHAADSDEIASPHVPPRPRPRKSGSKASTQRSVRHATRCPLCVISGHRTRSASCPLWVKSRHWSTTGSCPLY